MEKGILEQIKQIESSGSSYYQLKIEGETYSLWSSMPETLSEEDPVKFSYNTREKNGKTFKNITELEPVEEGRSTSADKRVLAITISGWLLDKKEEPIELGELLKKAGEIHRWLRGDTDAAV